MIGKFEDYDAESFKFFQFRKVYAKIENEN